MSNLGIGIVSFKYGIKGTDGLLHYAMYGEWIFQEEASIIQGANGAVLVDADNLIAFQPASSAPLDIYEG